MTVLLVLAAASAATAAAAIAGLLVRPRPRLVARLSAAGPPGGGRLQGAPAARGAASGGAALTPVRVLARLFGPPLRALAVRMRRVLGDARDHELEARLRHAGLERSPDEHRLRVAGNVVVLGSAGLLLGAGVLRSTLGTLLVTACGVLYGATRERGRLDRLVTERRERLRLELVTVNHLLAIQVRAGAGAIQSVQRVVDRGHGCVVEELTAALTWIRSGASESAALRRAAELTSEPSAARTYRLLATGAERGVDLAAALRSCSEDLRDQRREAIRRAATRRRAAMLIPTIVVLAPVMLLFIAAPLPTIVLGGR